MPDRLPRDLAAVHAHVKPLHACIKGLNGGFLTMKQRVYSKQFFGPKAKEIKRVPLGYDQGVMARHGKPVANGIGEVVLFNNARPVVVLEVAEQAGVGWHGVMLAEMLTTQLKLYVFTK